MSDVHTITFTQQVYIPASPTEIYEALMDEELHAAFTESGASISREVNGPFSVYDDYAHGFNKELISGKKIVQLWKAREEFWPEDHWSEITFDLVKKDKGTEIHFTHSNVPAALAENLKKGWIDFYWTPLKEFFSDAESDTE
ncbi:MAG: hypothetical protein Fur0041_12750 [Bacteroidia bacterium]